MANDGVFETIDDLRPEVGDSIDNETLRRILVGYEHDNLGEAVAADLVDAAPVAGDLLALERRDRAEQAGREYPERPAMLENVIGDAPPPLDTVGDLAISQNVISYLERESGL